MSGMSCRIFFFRCSLSSLSLRSTILRHWAIISSWSRVDSPSSKMACSSCQSESSASTSSGTIMSPIKFDWLTIDMPRSLYDSSS